MHGLTVNSFPRNKAEEVLERVLNKTGKSWTLNPAGATECCVCYLCDVLHRRIDGAFYGPKIDIHLKDALQRQHQTATIQVQLFPLQYKHAVDGFLAGFPTSQAIWP